jgi:hypothetical protein
MFIDMYTVFMLNFLPYKPTGACKFKYLQAHCDDDDDDSDDMEYTEDAIDNMILEFSRD